MSTKQTPKSCSCGACKRGKHSKAGHAMMKADERAFRHAAKIRLRKGEDHYFVAPKGNYYD